MWHLVSIGFIQKTLEFMFVGLQIYVSPNLFKGRIILITAKISIQTVLTQPRPQSQL